MTDTVTPDQLRAGLANDGFIVIPAFLTPEQLSRLRAAAAESTARARAGRWPHIRTLPKQFPPWSGDASAGIWGVQHLLHPALDADGAYAASYFDARVVGAVAALLRCAPDRLVMELYNLLVRPERDFALRWHRDDVGPDVRGAEEAARLARPVLHAQWNLALFDDDSLRVVPGSQARARTEAERAADPFADDMPGQRVVRLRAGDLMFYNNNILHRGVYDCRAERMTLHGSMGMRAADPARARNILQHGIGDWAAKCDFSALPGDMAETAKGMQSALLEMGGGGDVGFSQPD